MAEKKPLCDFGKQIEIALIQKDKTNDWLIENPLNLNFLCREIVTN